MGNTVVGHFWKIQSDPKNFGRPTSNREDGKRSRSGVELNPSRMDEACKQGRIDEMWTFGKVVTALRCRIAENQATG